jgi:hypothetical protein
MVVWVDADAHCVRTEWATQRILDLVECPGLAGYEPWSTRAKRLVAEACENEPVSGLRAVIVMCVLTYPGSHGCKTCVNELRGSWNDGVYTTVEDG